MSVTYEIRDDLVILEARGTLSNRDFVDAFADMIQDPAFRPGMPVLGFDRGIDYRLSARETDEAAGMISIFQRIAVGRCVFVTRDPQAFGLSRMIGAHATIRDAKFAVFKDAGEARAWLLKGEGETVHAL
jgi:hypothetical protein